MVGIVQLTEAVPVVVPPEELELEPEPELEDEPEPEDELDPDDELDPELEPEDVEPAPEEEELEPTLEADEVSAAVVLTASPPPQPEMRTAHAATGSMSDTDRARIFNMRFINHSST